MRFFTKITLKLFILTLSISTTVYASILSSHNLPTEPINNPLELAPCHKKVMQWVDQIMAEFPDRSISGAEGELLEMVVYNLYSDKFFVPVFKERFKDISKKNQKILLSTRGHAGCSKYLIGKYSELLIPVRTLNDQRVAVRFLPKFSHDVILEKTSLLRNARKEAKDFLKALKDQKQSLSLQDLLEWEQKIDNEYSILLPSETKTIFNAIYDNIAALANPEIVALAKSAAQKNGDFRDITQLRSFNKTNVDVYLAAEDDYKRRADKIIEDKILSILTTTTSKDLQFLDALTTDSNGLTTLHTNYNRLKSKYSEFSNYEQVIGLFSSLVMKKTELIGQMDEEINSQIMIASSAERLDQIREFYLSKVNLDNDNISRISQRIANRKSEVVKAKTERLDALHRPYEERSKLVTNVRNEAKELRKKLKIKYETNFPTLRKLFEIMWYVRPIGENGKYNVEDGKSFVSFIENIGFMQVDDELFSDHNSFKNSKGYEVSTFRLSDENNELKTAFAEFTVSNVPDDILQLYLMEFTSGYRESSNSLIRPWRKGDPIPNALESYIGNGNAFYSYKVENGDLKVSVLDNINGKLSHGVAARQSYNRLRVGSYTTRTDIQVKKGDVLELYASGYVTLGGFVGSSSPDGLKGLKTYNIDRRFNHGSLIGKIGNGDWFQVGSKLTITAKNSGNLSLRINDNDPSNNEGSFFFNYTIK